MTVTVAIPFTGANLDAFRQAVRSVFAQDCTDWLLLLVNDGASPELSEVADSIADSRVTHFNDGVNRGLVTRLNQIAGLSETPLLARMDADDIMFPDRLSRQIERFRRNPECDVLGGRAVAIDGHDKVLGLYTERPLPVEPVGYLRSNVFTHPTVTGRTDWFRANPYREITRAEDKELWLRTFRSSVFDKDVDPVLFYRVETEFNPGKAVNGTRGDRLGTRPYTKEFLSPLGRARFLGNSYAKELVYSTVGRYVWPYVHRRHILKLPGNAVEGYRKMVRIVSDTHVPGWTR
ncbi:glycosyltransferase [Raineyella sp. LH-20]|uniref:glycosyltransferase n=1 Tax=Raineyella sp. LH-20 TaxID=3081204 RepID=UPI0029530522|nr:glycosyltransferase [Raineyella sp. LH-20]WOP19683.1 glycosyltransferase [Raineyella sp. LH-20]